MRPVSFLLAVSLASLLAGAGPEHVLAEPCPEEGAASVEAVEEELLAFVGHYSHEELPLDLHVELIDGQLRVVIPARAAAYPLVPIEEARFCLSGAPSDATLDFREEGARMKALLTQNGSRIEFVRQGW